MKITIKSAAQFKQQLLDAGVPASQVKAAVALVKDKGNLRAGQTVTVPDRFLRADGAGARKAAVGDVAPRGEGRAAQGGKSMGALGIHAFDDVGRGSLAARSGKVVDACGSAELMFGAGFPGTDACGGSAPVRTRRSSVSASDGCGATVSTPRRRTVATSDGCGGSVSTRRSSNGGAC